MSSPSGGEIRYTLDGTDPGYFTLQANKSISIYDNKALPLTGDTVLVSARVKKDTLWSKLVRKEFLAGINAGDINYESLPDNGYFYNYPNPVQDFTHIMYSLSKSAQISLKIYHITGEQLITLEHGMKPAGGHSVTWNSTDIPSGTYICVLENITDAVSYRILIIKE